MIQIKNVYYNVIGLQNLDSSNALKFECEYCFLSILTGNDQIPRPEPSGNSASEPIPTDFGRFQIEMTCLYEPDVQSKCPKMVRHAKESMAALATQNGERLTQYSNTPSCDIKTNFSQR